MKRSEIYSIITSVYIAQTLSKEVALGLGLAALGSMLFFLYKGD